ncbi:MAG: pantoate--beta-alanine ligase [Hyphomicrobiaceae bacterium]
MAPRIEVVRTVADLRKRVRAWRAEGATVGLVPTMGALHAGHLALVAEARRRARRTITSIFVNPTQFAPQEDFGKYPRTFETDCALLAAAGCDLVWAPTVDVMYPEGFSTRVVPAGPAAGLESDFRPHFFGGVATVCAKLFLQTAADCAVFGEKDYQQLQVVRRMAGDLDIAIEIAGYPTVREADGLAMSSRNAYLSPAERVRAADLHRTLAAVAEALAQGDAVARCIEDARQALAAAGFRVDYLEARRLDTLAPLEAGYTGPCRLLVAAWLGETRLIDNIAAHVGRA